MSNTACAASEAEIARLREALLKIANVYPESFTRSQHGTITLSEYADTLDRCHKIARAALKPKP